MDELLPNSPKNPNNQIHDRGSREEEGGREEYYEGFERIYLPSRGVFYINDYKDMERLKVKPLDYTDEDILTTGSFYEDGSVFYELLKNAIVDENNFKARSLVPIDRDTILLWLRSSSFGNTYNIDYECPKCGFGNVKGDGPGEITWQIDKLEIPEFEETIYEQLREEGSIIVQVPQSKLRVKVSVPTIGMQMELEKRYFKKKENKSIKNDFFATSTLLSVVQGVEVSKNTWKYDKDQIDQHFKKIRLPLRDSRFILEEAKKLNLRYETKKDFICKGKDCGHIVEDVEMPFLHRNFFWPQP